MDEQVSSVFVEPEAGAEENNQKQQDEGASSPASQPQQAAAGTEENNQKREECESAPASQPQQGAAVTEKYTVGGNIESAPAFALIAGIFTDPKTGEVTKTSLPLTRMPAILGRTHDSNDEHHFGLGTQKAISRQHAVIYYRDKHGGRIDQVTKGDALSYKALGKDQKAAKVIQSNPDKPLSDKGFFVIECLGKNRIFVGKQRVEQGQVALLTNGSPVRMGHYHLYFLLPTNGSGPKTITVANPEQSTSTSFKKRKPAASASADGPAAKKKKAYTGGFAVMAQELESTPVDNLIKEMSEAIANNQWERRQQMIGTAVLNKAVRDAARSKRLQRIAKENGGAPRSDIIDWIRDNPTYSEWVKQLLTKMEFKSYQANVSKALVKADFIRSGTTGRHVKWILPKMEDEIDDDDEQPKTKSEEEQGVDENADAPAENSASAASDDAPMDQDEQEGGSPEEDPASDVEDAPMEEAGTDEDDEMEESKRSEHGPEESSSQKAENENDSNEDSAVTGDSPTRRDAEMESEAGATSAVDDSMGNDEAPAKISAVDTVESGGD